MILFQEIHTEVFRDKGASYLQLIKSFRKKTCVCDTSTSTHMYEQREQEKCGNMFAFSGCVVKSIQNVFVPYFLHLVLNV